jgi:protein-ribulosamine 3-kinase
MPDNRQFYNAIAESISLATGQSFSIDNIVGSSGGCINTCFIVDNVSRHYFIKTNRSSAISMFEAESLALNEIANTETLRVPLPVCTGQNSNHSWLVMENLQLQGQGQHQQLGKRLATMHQVSADKFGWFRNNTIGSTAQINSRTNIWPDFFRDQRLGFQLALAASNGYHGKLQKSGETLLGCMTDFFVDYSPQPSLLHGDLWGGNYAFLDSGEPVIFDPALYYGDRETDIAMTELFGGFKPEFRASYENCWPLDPGYETRKQLYNCYHILNHLNLFGGGYLAQAENIINKLLSERNA